MWRRRVAISRYLIETIRKHVTPEGHADKFALKASTLDKAYLLSLRRPAAWETS